ncbi:KN motif and ankyrin repeat domain-containing protein 1-like X5, partial [Biomphalaria glabrata]
ISLECIQSIFVELMAADTTVQTTSRQNNKLTCNPMKAPTACQCGGGGKVGGLVQPRHREKLHVLLAQLLVFLSS